MSQHESALAGFYDHEQQSPSGRRRHEAPDWGGDDLFTSAPRRRRFEHSGRRRETVEHALPRRVSGPAADRPAAPLPEPVRGASAVAERLDLGVIDDLLSTTAAEVAAPEPAVAPEPPVRTEEPPAAGRRTVTITGHPDRQPVRRRPAPTVDERIIGSRPDRIAAYAFALGLLLILIAWITAHA